MKKLVLLFTLFTLCVGCSNNSNLQSKDQELKNIISEGNYVIVDVRTKEEYESSHIIDAINIPLDEIDESIELDKNKKILVYCRSGNRSKAAKEILDKLNYTVLDLGAFESIDLERE